MEPLKRATDLLQETEATLRDLLYEAAKSGDYASVMQIAAWARALCHLIPPGGGTNKKLVVTGGSATKKNGKLAPPRTASALSKDGKYPRFFRHGDELIRLAWSKREKKEYRHKAPYGALKALAMAIAEKGSDGRVFSTDEFLPIQNAADGTDVPNYQAYVGISLLKHTGLIDQHGRQGYSIPRIADFKDAVDAVWKKLPQR